MIRRSPGASADRVLYELQARSFIRSASGAAITHGWFLTCERGTRGGFAALAISMVENRKASLTYSGVKITIHVRELFPAELRIPPAVDL